MVYLKSKNNKSWTINGYTIPPVNITEAQRRDGYAPWLIVPDEKYGEISNNAVFRSLLNANLISVERQEPQELSHTMERVESDNKALQGRIAALESQLKEQSAANERLFAQIAFLQGENDKLRSQNADLETRLSAVAEPEPEDTEPESEEEVTE